MPFRTRVLYWLAVKLAPDPKCVPRETPVPPSKVNDRGVAAVLLFAVKPGPTELVIPATEP
jgi:hypothetical protein